MSFTEQEIEEFKTEALELLELAEKSLLAIDGGSPFKVTFDAVFRGFHNLKGAAGMMDLTRLQSHTHELENILMRFKDEPTIPKEYVSLFLRGIDAARLILDNEDVSFRYNVDAATEAPAAEPTANNSAMAEFIAECDEILQRVSIALQAMDENQYDKKTVDGLYRDIHSLKGAAFLFSCTDLGNVAHLIENSLEPVRNESHKPSTQLIDAIFVCIEAIEAEMAAIKSGKINQTISKQIDELTQGLNRSAQKLEANKMTEDKKPAQQAVAAPDASSSSEAAASIRVPVALLDNLMTLMGEMVLVRNQVLQFSNQTEDLEFLNLSKRLNVVTSEIQGEMMKTRMQPIGNVLSKFNRVVRDLSHELGKQITLTIHGAETELDKSLLEAIKDPLTHIVRNSCDHGLEKPEQRRLAGKADAGNIIIKSFHEGGQVVIEISDDGRGLHKEVLINKGIERGLITDAQAKQMSEKEIFNLIFAPGFSTAAKVTNVSGRGVGMDVVRTNIEKIGGTVDLISESGRGTTIRIKIPLTLAIVPALIVNCGTGIYAIPQVKLVELVRVDQSSTENRIEYLQGAPVYRLRGNILPLVDLNKVLGVNSKKSESSQGIVNIAVLNAEHCSFGLIVDEVQDTADIVVKPLNRLLKSLQVYSGATILGDGSVALILDVLGLSKVAQIGRDEDRQAKSREVNSTEGSRLRDEVQDYLLIKVNSPTKHAIVLSYVHRLEEFSRKSIEDSAGQKVIRYRDSILPLIWTSEQLGYGMSQEGSSSENISVVVVKKAGFQFGIVVDSILDTLSTSTDVEPGLTARAGVFGNLNLPEELVVVVDPFELIINAYPNLKDVGARIVRGSVQNGNAGLSQGGLRILFAEDVPFFRRAVVKVLEAGGHQVIIAHDGQEALDLLNSGKHQIDLVVSDIEMPRMNGFTLARSVRANPSFAQLPLLALSSRADNEFTSEGIKAGFDNYLEKLKPDVLLKTIDELTSTKRGVA